MAGISKVWRNIARRRTNEREGSVKRVICSRYIQEVEKRSDTGGGDACQLAERLIYVFIPEKV